MTSRREPSTRARVAPLSALAFSGRVGGKPARRKGLTSGLIRSARGCRWGLKVLPAVLGHVCEPHTVANTHWSRSDPLHQFRTTILRGGLRPPPSTHNSGPPSDKSTNTGCKICKGARVFSSRPTNTGGQGEPANTGTTSRTWPVSATAPDAAGRDHGSFQAGASRRKPSGRLGPFSANMARAGAAGALMARGSRSAALHRPRTAWAAGRLLEVLARNGSVRLKFGLTLYIRPMIGFRCALLRFSGLLAKTYVKETHPFNHWTKGP